jgi:mannose-1-phosphate guanylyltransferase
MNSDRFVVIMAGGTGTRLWPLSRQAKPKQFLKLLADTSLLEETYAHVRLALPAEAIYIMADAPRAALAQEQLPELPAANLIIEPSSRDNGPAIGLASLLIEREHPGAKMAIIWSDHRVTKGEQFARCLSTAFDALATKPDHLVTIGIKPTRAATEFGYLKMGHELKLNLAEPVFVVDSFKEKPDAITAAAYTADWRFLWNTGVKVFRAQHMLDLFAQHQPADARLLDEIAGRHPKSYIDLWSQLTTRDIEHLITEKVKEILVIPADLGWNDIGSWSVVHDILKEQLGVEMVVKAEHIDAGSRDCLIMSDHRLIATAGLENIVIVDTPDALLVINKDAAQDVKLLVDELKARNSSLL